MTAFWPRRNWLRHIRWTAAGAAVALALPAAPVWGQIRLQADEAIAQPLPKVDEPVEPAGFTAAATEEARGQQRTAFAAGIAAVRRAGILERARSVGDKAVDFELADAAGYRIKASELWAMGPLVVVVYRGGWSSFCNAHLQEMQQSLRAIHALDAQLVAIGPESAERAAETQRRNKLVYPLLVDEGRAVARQLGIVYRAAAEEIPTYDANFDGADYGGEGAWELPLAATYVIDSAGVIRYAFLDADSSHRARPQRVLAVLRRLRHRSGPAPVARPTGNDVAELR